MTTPTSTPPAAARSRRAKGASAPAAPNRRQNILLAAERLFSERGFHGVSIRDVAAAAEVPLALVGYYFGPKLELYHEIYRQRAGYVQERLARLAKLPDAVSSDRLLEQIVEAFVLPVLKLAGQPDGRIFLRLMSRGMNDRLAEDEPVIRELFDPLAHAFIDALMRALPRATRGQVAWGYQFALGALLHHVIDDRVERLSLGANRAGDGDAAGPLLVAFIACGLRGLVGEA